MRRNSCGRQMGRRLAATWHLAQGHSKGRCLTAHPPARMPIPPSLFLATAATSPTPPFCCCSYVSDPAFWPACCCSYVSDPASRDPQSKESTRLMATSEAVAQWAGAQGTGGSGAPYHFICECFFLAAHALHLGLLKTLVSLGA